jgi:hypothetical protein
MASSISNGFTSAPPEAIYTDIPTHFASIQAHAAQMDTLSFNIIKSNFVRKPLLPINIFTHLHCLLNKYTVKKSRKKSMGNRWSRPSGSWSFAQWSHQRDKAIFDNYNTNIS